MKLIIGSHVSYKNDSQLLGSVKETISYGANTFMFYTGAPQNTNRGIINDNLTNEVKGKKDFDLNTSTITYFPEDGSYEISNHVEYGYVKETTANTFYIGNVKYRVENHGLTTGDFATIFYDIHGNISGVKAR